MLQELLHHQVSAVVIWGSVPVTHKGVLLEADDNFIKLEIDSRGMKQNIILISRRYLISIQVK